MSADTGPNGCVCGFNGDCNCPFEPSTVPVEEKPERKKRKKSTSPTQRTLAECRKRGWVAQVVERRLPRTFTTIDLFGVIDAVAIVTTDSLVQVGTAILGIQACAGTDHARRRDKILAEPRARQWVEAGGRLELWSWSKRGDRGKRKLWTLRAETYEEMVAGSRSPEEALAAIGADVRASR